VWDYRFLQYCVSIVQSIDDLWSKIYIRYI